MFLVNSKVLTRYLLTTYRQVGIGYLLVLCSGPDPKMKSGPGMTGQWASRHVRDVSFWSPTSVQHVPRRPHPRPPPCCPFSKRAAQNSKQKEIDLLPLLVGFKPGSHVDPVGKGSTYIYTLSVCLFSENQTTGLGPLN